MAPIHRLQQLDCGNVKLNNNSNNNNYYYLYIYLTAGGLSQFPDSTPKSCDLSQQRYNAKT
jgi:hypothetical protein